MLNLDNEKLKQGYIKLYRSMLNWEWFTDVNTTHLFLYCLLKANHKKADWRGITIDRGSLITSVQNLSNETGLSKQNVRTSIKNLVSTNEITHKSTHHYSIITVKNYDLYQEVNKPTNKQLTNNQHTPNTRLTTNNNNKNNNNDNNIDHSIISSSCILDDCSKTNNEENTPPQQNETSDLNPERLKDLQNWYGEYANVHLTKDQYNRLSTFILNDDALNEIINELSENIACKRDKALPYDEKFPAMHYIALKKYWQFKYFKQTPQRKEQKTETDNVSKELDRIFEKMENEKK